MPEAPDAGENSDAVALGLIGDEWNLMIVRLAILSGVRRYKDFRDQLGIANSVLTVRLRHLTEAGVFTRAQYSDTPRRYEYVLTRRGRDLWKVLLTIWSWEAEWVSEHIEPLPRLLHTECGQRFLPVMRCRTCGDPAGIRDVHAAIGPSGGFQRSAPRVATRRRSTVGPAGPGLVPQTIELIGNRWSAAALAAALFGARRFTDMLTMTGAPPTIVADRLRTFCQMGVLTTVTRPGSSRAEYRLTDKGRAFFPHVMMMLEWGDRWFRAPEGAATLLTHTACGREFHPMLHCSACGYELYGTRIQVDGGQEQGQLASRAAPAISVRSVGLAPSTQPEVSMPAEPRWAVLRHLVLAADDAIAASARLAAALRLPEGFGDPELAAIGLTDRNMPVGGQKYLEVVGPLGPGSYINRWLARVGGQGGYCLSVQVPDAPACRQRALDRGVRLAADQDVLGHPIVQLHPADAGVLLELDAIPDAGRWFWDDITPGPRPDALIDDITAVTVGVPDPEAAAALWAAIIGLELAGPARLDFSGCAVEFTAHPRGQLLAATFRLAAGAPDASGGADPAGLPATLLGLDAAYAAPAAAESAVPQSHR